MSKKTIFSLSIIIFVLFVGLWAFYTSSQLTKDLENNSKKSDNQENNEVTVEGLIITETREGKKFWEIYAESGVYDDSGNNAVLKEVKGNFYKDNKVIMSFEAPVGKYNEKTKDIELSGGSNVATDDDIFVSAKTLMWSGTRDKITANGNVKIRKASDLMTISESAIFNTGFSNLRIIGNSKTNIYAKG